MNVVELPGGLTVAFREATPEDESLIFATWLNSHRSHGDWPRRVGSRRYFDEHKLVVARLLARASVKVLVACNPVTPWQALGYIVFEPGVLHWVHVKEPFRWDPQAEHHPRLGTALFMQAMSLDVGQGRSIVPHDTPCTHWTTAAERLADKWGLVYRPFMLEAQ